MKISIKKVRENALALSSSERASLIHDLIISLEDESGFDLPQAYEDEIQLRLKNTKEGNAICFPAESIFAELEKKFT